MSWKQLTIRITNKDILEKFEDFLWDNGALSVTIEDNQDEPLFEYNVGEMPIWQDIKIKVLYDINEDFETIRQNIIANFGYKNLSFLQEENIKNQNWQAICQNNFQPMQFGKKLWVSPSWHNVPNNAEILIKLDPGMAFGTGTHPTTGLCLDWLEKNIITGQTVVDYGCGSGILAIAAKKLGADQVYAVDNDPEAIISTKENAKNNQIESDIYCYLPNETPQIKADVVVANILANPLCELKQTLLDLLNGNGKLILSGILAEQTDLILNCYKNFFSSYEIYSKDGWIMISFLN